MEDWRSVQRTRPLNRELMAQYRRVFDAVSRIGGLRLGELGVRRGVRRETVADRLDLTPVELLQIEHGDDPRLSAVAGYIAALGGELELRAVFEDETVELLGHPPP